MDIFLLGDFNIDWATKSSPKKKIDPVLIKCRMTQVMDQPTRVTIDDKGIKTSTIIDHIYTNIPSRCSKITSTPTGCSDHNLISVTVERNVPKPRKEIIFQRSYEMFDEASYIRDIRRAQWTEVHNESDPEDALSKFTGIFSNLADKHAPLVRDPAENDDAPWMDEEIKSLMSQRVDAKEAIRISTINYQTICNKLEKAVFAKKEQQRLREADNNIKKIQEILNDFMRMNSCSPVTNIESEGRLITDDTEIANYFNHYYVDKTEELRRSVRNEGRSSSRKLIKERIMKDKQCSLSFVPVDVEKIESLLLSLSDDISPGTDNMDVRLLKEAASHISAPLRHIVNQCLERGVFPSQWRESSAHFNAENSTAVSLLPVLSHILEKLIHEQILKYFMDNELI
ncbi:uncharacterized protein LOC122965685, partial [Scomber scombrus]